MFGAFTDNPVWLPLGPVANRRGYAPDGEFGLTPRYPPVSIGVFHWQRLGQSPFFFLCGYRGDQDHYRFLKLEAVRHFDLDSREGIAILVREFPEITPRRQV